MSGGRRLCPGADGEVSRICARHDEAVLRSNLIESGYRKS